MVISSTRAALVSIQAVSPVSIFGVAASSCAKAGAAANASSAKAAAGASASARAGILFILLLSFPCVGVGG